nr:Chain B, Guanine nucleotide-binding protein G(t) subunit alpha-1 [Bos taurus]4J4Q_B Chain B, Guanine nucleotide-binding protein G(t) subunit alpha-1 [Bos taurus]5EN0_B Chain B, Guanine nucleotide-binding protein G(t) subunit alpha-3 [Bos taurus]5WKT_B Chain B, Transducin Galpha peptide [Bos taurus]6NWE_B Chain B, ILENLKDVGLF peptide CT2 [Bos taurus]6PEL_B Chain B, ILENLKDVGLF G alpha peptide CT2 [Bos taurus]6PGS_B Chain B, G alpha CT2 peptide [Bos taurus]6PH7_B Chain B, G protein CT2 pept
ILENLKDVGLF